MGLRIYQNIESVNAHRQLTVNQGNLSKSIERLSSGLRINRAGDDAAGLAISEKMRGQIRGLKQAQRNAQDGISLIQTAEGALQESHSILQRMRELAVQAANDSNTLTDRKEIQKEMNQLLSEIDRIADNTQFNTQNLLDGSFTGKIIHIGANENQNLALNFSTMRTDGIGGGVTPAAAATADVGGVTFTAKQAGLAGNSITVEFVDPAGNDKALSVAVSGNAITVNLGTDGTGGITSTVDGIVAAINGSAEASALVSAGGTGSTPVSAVGSTSLANGTDAVADATVKIADLLVADPDTATTGGVLDQASADVAITNIQKAIEQVSAERSKLGAYQNRLEHTIANLGTSAENLQAAESRIRDVDMAAEMMDFTKNQILQQAGVAMLAQANQAPQAVLQLLR